MKKEGEVNVLRKREEDRDGGKVEDEDEQVYSDQEDGVEIVDIEKVRLMDWMAPESLRKEKKPSKKKKVKAEEVDKKDKGACHVSASQLDLTRYLQCL